MTEQITPEGPDGIILRYLTNNPPPTVGQLIHGTGLSKTTVWFYVKKLEKLRIVTRKWNGKRNVIVFTENAKEIEAKWARLFSDFLVNIGKVVQDEDLGGLFREMAVAARSDPTKLEEFLNAVNTMATFASVLPFIIEVAKKNNPELGSKMEREIKRATSLSRPTSKNSNGLGSVRGLLARIRAIASTKENPPKRRSGS